MRRVPVVFLLAVVALLTLAAPAWAHTELVSASPAAEASSRTAPAAVTLTFTEAVDERLATVAVRSAGGATLAAGPPQQAGLALVQSLQGGGPGRYSVEWRAAAADGHILGGTYAFSVGDAGDAVDGGGDAPTAAAASTEGTSPLDYLRNHTKGSHGKPSYAISAADRRGAKTPKAAAPPVAAGSAGAAPADAAPEGDNASATIVALLVAAVGVTTVAAVVEGVRAHRV